MTSPELALLVKAPEEGLGRWKQEARVSRSSRRPGRCLSGCEGGSVWHFSTRTALGLQDVWPSGTWELGGDANLAWWLHPASANAPEQPQSMKHTLVLRVGNSPAWGAESQPGDYLGFCSAAPAVARVPQRLPGCRSSAEGSGVGRGLEARHRGLGMARSGGGGVPAFLGKPDPGLGRFPWCKRSHHSLRSPTQCQRMRSWTRRTPLGRPGWGRVCGLWAGGPPRHRPRSLPGLGGHLA